MKMPDNEKIALLDFYRHYTGLLRSTMKDPQRYVQVFHTYESYVKVSNIEKTPYYFGYMI